MVSKDAQHAHVARVPVTVPLVTIPPAKAGGFVWTSPNDHYHAKASWPTRDAIKSGAVTNPLVARFLAALWSAWASKPQRRQENSACERRFLLSTYPQRLQVRLVLRGSTNSSGTP